MEMACRSQWLPPLEPATGMGRVVRDHGLIRVMAGGLGDRNKGGDETGAGSNLRHTLPKDMESKRLQGV